MKTIKDINIEGKKVIIRCDFNVPIKDGKIIDDTRIKASLKTINYCLEHNAKVILLSHLGRVKEEADLKKNDLAPVATRLSELLDKKVTFVNATRGQTVEDAISNIKEFGEDKVLARNPEEQKWYYTSVYKSCIANVDENHPIFVRYKKILEEIWK